ncbi:MAG: M48 family metalloprotease [Candidatus Aminicenantes bacterium]|nr:M48 family metalloprotease [Candidatus Aminicenantes bacterium]
MSPTERPDFYEVQKHRWRISLAFTAVLGLVYLLICSAFVFFALGAADLVLGDMFRVSSGLALRAFLWTAAGAVLLTLIQYVSARRSGAAFILKRLGAATPDRSDLLHVRFLNIVEEMRISSGLPRTNAYVLPFLAVNSLALVEADGTPAVVITEGLLAEGTREELQAAVAHEVAHILKGDVFYITLLCSLADVFDRMALALMPETDKPIGFPGVWEAGAGRALPSAAQGIGSLGASLSGAALRVLSLLVSRERELLADAAAVELCRDPVALARVLYKAGLKNTFVGDFSLVYAPLLMVSSDPSTEGRGVKASLFHTHPPLSKRIKALTAMAAKTPDEIIDLVWESQRQRAESRTLVHAREEDASFAAPIGRTVLPLETAEADRIWSLQETGRSWTEAMTEEELVSHPKFSLLLVVRNERDKVEARAREFPAVRRAVRRLGRRQIAPEAGKGNESCPRCRRPLRDDFYEGVAVKACPACRGKLVSMSGVERILTRKQYAFSENLVRKALEFKKTILRNPLVAARKAGRKPPSHMLCPRCGARMISLPYNYQFFIPVDKCLSCRRIWFDADELEMLQVLVEQHSARGMPTPRPEASGGESPGSGQS